MKESALKIKSKAFALRIIKMYNYLCEEKKEYVMSKQILRSGTSIGANVAEAFFAQSDADFYNTAAKSNRFGTQDKPNKNVIRTWATTQEKSIQRISRPK